MISCDHFVYALFDGIGYKLIKTRNVVRILGDRNVSYLAHLGDRLDGDAYIQIWWPTEKAVTVSYVSPRHDEYGRKGVWNHTIILPIHDFLRLSQPATMLKAHFLPRLDVPPTSLSQIQIPEPAVDAIA